MSHGGMQTLFKQLLNKIPSLENASPHDTTELKCVFGIYRLRQFQSCTTPQAD